MSLAGVKSNNLASTALADSVLVNRNGTTYIIPVERLSMQMQAVNGPTYETRAELFGDLDWGDGSIAKVVGDVNGAYRGIYKKIGASGAGSWIRIGPLPEADAATKLDNTMATARFLGRTSAADGLVEQLTPAEAKTLLAITAADIGSLPADRLLGRDTAGTGPAGLIAVTGGLAFSGSSQLVLADMAQATFKGRVAGAGTGPPTDMSAAQAKVALVLVKADVGLGSVDNTPDAMKPVSTAQAAAIASAVNAEAVDRGNADTALQGNINAEANTRASAVQSIERVGLLSDGDWRPGADPRRWSPSALGLPAAQARYSGDAVAHVADEGPAIRLDGAAAACARADIHWFDPAGSYLVTYRFCRAIDPPSPGDTSGAVRVGGYWLDAAGASDGSPTIINLLGVTVAAGVQVRRYLITPLTVSAAIRAALSIDGSIPRHAGYGLRPYIQGMGTGQATDVIELRVERIDEVINEAIAREATVAVEASARLNKDADLQRRNNDVRVRAPKKATIADALSTFTDRAGGELARWKSNGLIQFMTTSRGAKDAVLRQVSPFFSRSFGLTRHVLELLDNNKRPFVAVDDRGRVLARGANGRLGPARVAQEQPTARAFVLGADFTTSPSRWLNSGVDHGWLSIGQSLASGAANYDAGTAPITATAVDPGYVVMPDTPQGAFFDNTSFHEDYIDARSIELFTGGVRNVGEQVIMGAAQYFTARCQAVFGAKPRVVVTTIARGGWDLNQFAPGSQKYKDVLDAVALNIRASLKSGKVYEVKHVLMPHGESMFQVGYYPTLAAYRTFIRCINADIRALTGQDYDPIWHVHSPDRNVAAPAAVSLGTAQRVFHQLQLAGLVRIVGPVYAWSLGAAPGDGHPIIYGYFEGSGYYGDSIWEAETSHNVMTCTICTHITAASSTAVDAWISVRPGATLTRDDSGTIVGAYGGPSTGSGAYDGGVHARDKDGALGAESAVIGAGSDGLTPIRLTMHRAYDPATLVVMFAARSDNAGNTWGVQANGARTLFRSDAAQPALPGQTRARYDWLVPSQHRMFS